MNLYLVAAALLALLIGVHSGRRDGGPPRTGLGKWLNTSGHWAFACLLLMPVVLPAYFFALRSDIGERGNGRAGRGAVAWVLFGVGVVTLAAFANWSAVVHRWGPGFDQKLDMSSEDEWKADVTLLTRTFTQEQYDSWTWAISDLDYAAIKKQYPNATPRQIVAGVNASFEKTIKAVVDVAEKALAEEDRKSAEIAKVSATAQSSTLGRDFFGPLISINVAIKNNSRFGYSQLGWHVAMRLDDNADPVAEANITDSYAEGERGLNPGQEAHRTLRFTSFGQGYEDWYSPAVQQAKKRVITLTPLVASAQDLAGDDIVSRDMWETMLARSKVTLESTAARTRIAQAPSAHCLFFCPERSIPEPQAKTAAATERAVDRSSCTNHCVNGSCIRTLPDGTKEQWQAERRYNSMSGEWEWDTNSCGN